MKNLLLHKTVRILERIVSAPEPPSLKELAAELDLHPATVSRVASDLVEAGFVEKFGYRRFAPAPGLIRLGGAAAVRSPLARVALPLLRERTAKLGVGGFLGGWQQEQFFYLYRSEGTHVSAASPWRSGLAAILWAKQLSWHAAETRFRTLFPDKSDALLAVFRRDFDAAGKQGYLIRREGRSFWSIGFPLEYGEAHYAVALCGKSAVNCNFDRMLFECSLLASRIHSDLEELKQEKLRVEKA